jgi:hypothetical protein
MAGQKPEKKAMNLAFAGHEADRRLGGITPHGFPHQGASALSFQKYLPAAAPFHGQTAARSG